MAARLLVLWAALPMVLGAPSAAFAEEPVTLEDAVERPASPDDIPLKMSDDTNQRRNHLEAQALLNVYGVGASGAVLGTVVTTRSEYGLQRALVISLDVSEVLRGESGRLLDVRIPLVSDEQVVPEAITGYNVLVFLDSSNNILGGDAFFVVEGGYAWRQRNPGVFSLPSADRFWITEIDPFEDYLALRLEDVRFVMGTNIRRLNRIRRRQSKKNKPE